MWLRSIVAVVLLAWSAPTTAPAGESLGVRPLHMEWEAAVTTLPPQTHLLIEQSAIERFLEELDGLPPDWAKVYGHGHHDPDHDERLFALNRQRDAARVGKAPLQWLIAFVWAGELSSFDEQEGGFHVALGPTFNRTGWGEVRFKYEDLPATLIAVAGDRTPGFKARLQQGERLAVDVLLAGRLIPEESLVYDFSHEEEGRGLIMPLVRVEAVEFVLKGGSRGRE